LRRGTQLEKERAENHKTICVLVGLS